MAVLRSRQAQNGFSGSLFVDDMTKTTKTSAFYHAGD
jgi:hypothetical protein